MLKEVVAFKRAFEGLAAFLLDPDDPQFGKVAELYNYVASRFAAVRRQDFDTFLPKEVSGLNMREERQSLILRPLENEQQCVPVLFVKYSAKETTQRNKQPYLGQIECRIVLGLFTVDQSIAKGNGSPIRAIGLRFELTEGDGIHDYAHVQLVKSMKKGDDDLPGAPVWLPDSQPAIQLDGDPRDASALIIAVIQSLYGTRATAIFKKQLEGLSVKGARSPRVMLT